MIRIHESHIFVLRKIHFKQMKIIAVYTQLKQLSIVLSNSLRIPIAHRITSKQRTLTKLKWMLFKFPVTDIGNKTELCSCSSLSHL